MCDTISEKRGENQGHLRQDLTLVLQAQKAPQMSTWGKREPQGVSPRAGEQNLLALLWETCGPYILSNRFTHL